MRSPAATVTGWHPRPETSRAPRQQRPEVGGTAGGRVVDATAGALDGVDGLEVAVEVVEREQVELDVVGRVALLGGQAPVDALGVTRGGVGGGRRGIRAAAARLSDAAATTGRARARRGMRGIRAPWNDGSRAPYVAFRSFGTHPRVCGGQTLGERDPGALARRPLPCVHGNPRAHRPRRRPARSGLDRLGRARRARRELGAQPAGAPGRQVRRGRRGGRPRRGPALRSCPRSRRWRPRASASWWSAPTSGRARPGGPPPAHARPRRRRPTRHRREHLLAAGRARHQRGAADLAGAGRPDGRGHPLRGARRPLAPATLSTADLRAALEALADELLVDVELAED